MGKLVKDLDIVINNLEPTSDLFKSMQEIRAVLQDKEEEMMRILHTALCNGLCYVQGYGLDIDISDDDYTAAKDDLKRSVEGGVGFCAEDVLMHHLRLGKTLYFYDEEGEERVGFDIDQVVTNLQNPIAAKHISDILSENDDAITADCIIQICLFNDIIYG